MDPRILHRDGRNMRQVLAIWRGSSGWVRGHMQMNLTNEVVFLDAGNRKINLLTSSAQMELRVDMRDLEGNSRYAQYSNFHVGTEAESFVLTVIGYNGTAGKCKRKGLNTSTRQILVSTFLHKANEAYDGHLL